MHFIHWRTNWHNWVIPKQMAMNVEAATTDVIDAPFFAIQSLCADTSLNVNSVPLAAQGADRTPPNCSPQTKPVPTGKSCRRNIRGKKCRMNRTALNRFVIYFFTSHFFAVPVPQSSSIPCRLHCVALFFLHPGAVASAPPAAPPPGPAAAPPPAHAARSLTFSPATPSTSQSPTGFSFAIEAGLVSGISPSSSIIAMSCSSCGIHFAAFTALPPLTSTYSEQMDKRM